MGLFSGPLFDFNGDGEAIDLTGDDSFYIGNDTLDDEEEL